MDNPVIPQEFEFVIGIGDFHGHLPAMEELFRGLHKQYGIFKDFKELVLKPGVRIDINGDRIDRGNEGLKIIENCMLLDERNIGMTGQQFGNHELLALAGLSTVIEALEKPEEEMYDYYRMSSVHGFNGGVDFIREFGDNPQSAFKTYLKRMNRDGDIGEWMRGLKAFDLVKAADKRVLFVNGGIPAGIREPLDLLSYLQHFQDHMRADSAQVGYAAKYMDDKLVGDHSVFWDRDIATGVLDPDKKVDELGLDYVVIGHTPASRITRYGSKVFNIDVGMCPKYGENEPSAIVFRPEGIFVYNAIRNLEEKLIST